MQLVALSSADPDTLHHTAYSITELNLEMIHTTTNLGKRSHSVMSSPPIIETFKGTSWEECDDFIRAIRAVAWREGKIQDPRWIADFASLHFSRKALSWYSRLPQDIREDWAKLQVALLDRWPSPEDDEEPRIEPTPAAAPSLNLSDRADRPLQGALKIADHGSNTKSYLKLHKNGYVIVTTNANEAIRIRCSSLPNATLLGRIDGTRHSWLAIQWSGSKPKIKEGSNAYAYLVFVDSVTLQTSPGWNTLHQLVSCTPSTDGEITPVWENKDTSKVAMGIFLDSNGVLYVAADPNAYSAPYFDRKRVKLFIESID